MELSRREKIFFWLAALWPLLLLALGMWWLYLLFLLGEELQSIELKHGLIKVNLSTLVRFEGPFFLALLLASTAALVFLYWRDRRRHRSWQLFFASLSHELRTPLASIQLQAEVMREKCLKQSNAPELIVLADRLLEDGRRLEHEFDQLLQLSRIESDSKLPLENIHLKNFIRHFLKSQHLPFTLNLTGEELKVQGNALALKLIMRNLLTNTLRHRQGDPLTPVQINLQSLPVEKNIFLLYGDGGPAFQGEIKQLGRPFYKFQSQQGAGLGLYLTKKLMRQMGGSALYLNRDGQFFTQLSFPFFEQVQ